MTASPDVPRAMIDDASVFPSQLLTVESLRRPVESTGHVANAVKAQGGLSALLKSSPTTPFLGIATNRNRPPGYVVDPVVPSRKMKKSSFASSL